MLSRLVRDHVLQRSGFTSQEQILLWECVCVCVCVVKTDSALGLCVCCVCVMKTVKIFKTMESRKWGWHTRGPPCSPPCAQEELTVPGPSLPPTPLPGSPARLSAPPFPHLYCALSYFELLVIGIICKQQSNNSSSSSQDLCVPCPFELGVWGGGGSGDS